MNLGKLFLHAGRVNLCHSAFRSSSADLIRTLVQDQLLARRKHQPSCILGILLDPQRHKVAAFRNSCSTRFYTSTEPDCQIQLSVLTVPVLESQGEGGCSFAKDVKEKCDIGCVYNLVFHQLPLRQTDPWSIFSQLYLFKLSYCP